VITSLRSRHLRVLRIVFQTGAVRVMLRPLQGNSHRYYDTVQSLNHLCDAIQTVLFHRPKFAAHSLSVQKRRHHEGLLSAALSRSSTSLTYLSGYDAGCIILSLKAYCLRNQTVSMVENTMETSNLFF
jgi:hypothetical protein